MTMDRIAFYQEVQVSAECGSPEYRGLKGAVLGISQEDGVVYGYAVLLHGESTTTYFKKDEITATGKHFSRGDYY
ncbi:hypothetical protein EGJ34_03870 [Stenotrophomonas sp. 278]|nr:hypothetical protein EGJ34_03870 [Stenotrophomonas sp. 278]